MENISYHIIAIFIIIVFIYSVYKRTNTYEAFIKGAVDSMKVGIGILPYLLSMFVAVNVFKASGILDNIFKFYHVPNELFIQGFFRPISSHASLSVMLSIFNEYGVDSNVGIASSILQGGSDTTIYVMGLYFGSIGIKKTRHSYVVGLICDGICIFLSIVLFLFIIK